MRKTNEVKLVEVDLVRAADWGIVLILSVIVVLLGFWLVPAEFRLPLSIAGIALAFFATYKVMYPGYIEIGQRCD